MNDCVRSLNNLPYSDLETFSISPRCWHIDSQESLLNLISLQKHGLLLKPSDKFVTEFDLSGPMIAAHGLERIFSECRNLNQTVKPEPINHSSIGEVRAMLRRVFGNRHLLVDLDELDAGQILLVAPLSEASFAMPGHQSDLSILTTSLNQKRSESKVILFSIAGQEAPHILFGMRESHYVLETLVTKDSSGKNLFVLARRKSGQQ